MSTLQFSYLGPAGTFTEAALHQVRAAIGQRWKAVANPVQAISDVLSGESIAAVIPIENSVEGGVSATQDALAAVDGIRIVGEYLVPIRFSMFAAPGTRLEDVRVVTTHPVAYAQCHLWLNERLPEHEFIPASSNAQAAASVFESSAVDAAIAGDGVLAHYDLATLATDIGDQSTAVTRFVLIAGDDYPSPEPTGSDKTSLIVELPHDRAGTLMAMLEQFAVRGINLSRIESRPVGDALGRYRFNIDAEGHILDARLGEALMGLRRFSPKVQFLGSYPRADGAIPIIDPVQDNESYASAQAWLDALRSDRGRG